MEDTLKMLPREGLNGGAVAHVLRSNSSVAKVRDVLKKAGKPLHINDLIVALDRPNTRMAKGAITSSLSAYVRRGEIFTRTAPNTYGLVEMNGGRPNPPSRASDELADLPEDFGKDDD